MAKRAGSLVSKSASTKGFLYRSSFDPVDVRVATLRPVASFVALLVLVDTLRLCLLLLVYSLFFQIFCVRPKTVLLQTIGNLFRPCI
jgi:hypothetical protein